MIAIKDQRDVALRAELAEVRQRLKTEEALRKAQADYAHANTLSEVRLDQLASVTHDIQTPVRTLRTIVDKIDSQDANGT